MNTSSFHLPVASPARLRGRVGSQRQLRAARAPQREAPALLTLAEVRRQGFTVIGSEVFDLRRFAKHHPGGSFLSALVGQDATLAVENAHGKTMAPMLARFRVGAFAEATREPLERDVLALRDELRREGLFTYRPARFAFDVARWVFCFGIGMALAAQHQRLGAFAFLLAGTIDVVWWIHDAGHDAIFDRPQITRPIIDWLGTVVLGMPQQGYHYGVHRIHHGFTNIVGIDRALETGPLSWTEEMARNKPAAFRRGRVLQWFVGILPAAGPALLHGAIVYAIQKKQHRLLAVLALRWAAVAALAVVLRAPELVVLPWVAGSILAFMAGLNHFHLPMGPVAPPSYVRAIFERTQNIAGAGRFWHWLSGGLDCHVEHHLFPTMASHRYPAIVPRVRALASKHGLPYLTTSRSGAVMNLVRTLLAPLGTPRLQSSLARAVETSAAVVVRALAVFFPFIVLAGVVHGGVASFAGVIVVFGVLTVVEGFLALSGVGALSRPGDEEATILGKLARAQLWIYGLGHVLVVPFVVLMVGRGGMSKLEILGAGLSLASMGGTVGGLGGHELMHKRTLADRVLGIAIYATSNYGHFISSHVGGHHVNVGLRNDWGTARRGETIYAFLVRAIVDGYVGGLRIEGARRRKQGLSPYRLGNFVVRYSVVTVGLWIAIGAVFGVATLAFFLAVSLVTIAFMELFNYISHYALERPEPTSQARSAIEPEHTWESNNKVVNWFIFNAGMHCHHHQKPAHGFESLTLFHEDKAYIPHGIAGMALLAFAAPLYLRKMDRILGQRAEGAQSSRAEGVCGA